MNHILVIYPIDNTAEWPANFFSVWGILILIKEYLNKTRASEARLVVWVGFIVLVIIIITTGIIIIIFLLLLSLSL